MVEAVAEKAVSPIEPFGDRVVAKLLTEDRTAGGLFIPDSAKDKPNIGIVLAVGPGVTEKVVPGDRIAFAKYAGTQLKIEGQDYLFLAQRDILGKFEAKGVE